MAKTDPEAVARFLEADTCPEINGKPAVWLAISNPELAMASTVTTMGGKDRGSDEFINLELVARVVAGQDTRLAIRLINSSGMSENGLVAAICGAVEGFDFEKLSPAEFSGLLASFPEESLRETPRVARATCFYRFFKPEEVLAAFPLDGEPWQRTGAIAYLESAATNGNVEVRKFLESPQSNPLTEEERNNLLNRLGASSRIRKIRNILSVTERNPPHPSHPTPPSCPPHPPVRAANFSVPLSPPPRLAVWFPPPSAKRPPNRRPPPRRHLLIARSNSV